MHNNGGLLFLLISSPIFHHHHHHSKSSSFTISSSKMVSSLIIPLIFLYLSLIIIPLLLYNLLKRVNSAQETPPDPPSKTSISSLKISLSKLSDKTPSAHQFGSTHLPQSILLELFSSVNGGGESKGTNEEDNGSEVIEKSDKKKRKKRKVKRKEEKGDLQVRNESGDDRKELGLKKSNGEDEELVCFYPFTSSSSTTQRKIRQQYDELVKSQESNKGLTLAQIGQFINCLVDARNELQLKSESIRRRFTITKALLVKADRSSFDRLRKQVYKLELEQKRLEDDAFVYNWLQHQLKLSPAYKKMLEISASTELKAKPNELVDNQELEQNNISFEEFLEQEKKDKFWQKYGKHKLSSS